jgi:hypothetical protein
LRRACIRRLASACAAALVLAAGGCGRLGTGDPHGAARSLSYDWPAAANGAVCGLLDYGTVAEELGTTFDTAAGATLDDTYTCAVTRAGHEFPDLSLSLSSTDADVVIFSVSVAPDGSSPVKGLGRAAYMLQIPATSGNGPALEYGWLSAKPRLFVVRYTFGPGAPAADLSAMAPRLLTLARRVETTT